MGVGLAEYQRRAEQLQTLRPPGLGKSLSGWVSEPSPGPPPPPPGGRLGNNAGEGPGGAESRLGLVLELAWVPGVTGQETGEWTASYGRGVTIISCINSTAEPPHALVVA